MQDVNCEGTPGRIARGRRGWDILSGLGWGHWGCPVGDSQEHTSERPRRGEEAGYLATSPQPSLVGAVSGTVCGAWEQGQESCGVWGAVHRGAGEAVGPAGAWGGLAGLREPVSRRQGAQGEGAAICKRKRAHRVSGKSE